MRRHFLDELVPFLLEDFILEGLLDEDKKEKRKIRKLAPKGKLRVSLGAMLSWL